MSGFNSYREYARFIETKYPRDGRPEAAFAHGIACGWRCECAKSGRDAALKPKAMTPGEKSATEPEAERWRAEARRQAWMAQSYCGSVPQYELAADWLAYKGRSPDGRLLE